MKLPNNVRLRPDLIIQPQDCLGGTWVVKDPVSLRYFLFGSDEHFILQRLDGSRTQGQLIDDFASHRAPRRMTARRLHAFLHDLFRKGLVCSDAPHHGERLLEQGSQQTHRAAMSAAMNWLAIRLPGINPAGLLDTLYDRLRWLYSPLTLMVCLLTWCWAVAIAIANFDSLLLDMPRAGDFVDGRNLMWLAVALAGTKVCHELGHALTCRHFGGQCNELGIMFLLFTPCLYCNVTDAWMLRSRWQRIAISAAGILVEIQLAAMATILWHYSHPGILHSIAVNVILVCSVGTLLFNGNPLLKFDGYFILSDLVNSPNLWEKSRQVLNDSLSRFVTESGPDATGFRSGDLWLVVYAIASITYRIVLLATIALFLYSVLHPLGFDLVFVAFAVVVGGSMIYSQVTSFAKWLRRPTVLRRVRGARIALLVGGAAAVLAFALAVPLPCKVAAPALLQPAGADRVYAATPGEVIDAATYGDVVNAGDPVLQLDNPPLRVELIDLRAQLAEAEVRLEGLAATAATEDTSAAQIQVTQALVNDLQQQVCIKQRRIDELSTVAKQSGRVIAPPMVASGSQQDSELPPWTGRPLDVENRGCFLERGTLVCLIGEAATWEAVAFVDESDVRYVEIDQTARVQLSYDRPTVLAGRVVEVSKIDADEIPTELAAMQDLAAQRAASGAATPLRTVYQLRIDLGRLDSEQLTGARGRVKIKVEPQTLARRMMRWFRRTLRSEPASRS